MISNNIYEIWSVLFAFQSILSKAIWPSVISVIDGNLRYRIISGLSDYLTVLRLAQLESA